MGGGGNGPPLPQYGSVPANHYRFHRHSAHTWDLLLVPGAEPRCPLGGPWPLQKKKKYPLECVRKLIGPPYVGHLAPPISHHSPI